MLDFPNLFERLADLPADNSFAITQNPANRIAWPFTAGRTLRSLRRRCLRVPAYPVGLHIYLI